MVEVANKIRYVYRALNKNDYKSYVENKSDIVAKNTEGKWNLKQHILDGSKSI